MFLSCRGSGDDEKVTTMILNIKPNGNVKKTCTLNNYYLLKWFRIKTKSIWTFSGCQRGTCLLIVKRDSSNENSVIHVIANPQTHKTFKFIFETQMI